MTGILVTVAIPTWNEAAHIDSCLERIAAQQWRPVEVVIADGNSTDETITRARAAAHRLGLDLRVVKNPARRTANGLNAALAQARGDVIVRVDARSRIGDGHIARAVHVLGARPEVGVVGGGQRACARSSSIVDRGIARALRNRYTTGLGRYRRASAPGPADTVWMGAFRADELRRLGGWDEAVALNEDYDLNRRYRATGSLVWFDPEMDAEYVPRPDLYRLALQYFRFGRVKGTWWARGTNPAPRQVVLVLAPIVLVSGAAVAALTVGAVPTALAALAALCTVDGLGGERGASPAERAVAMAAATVSCGSWWAGVVFGLIGERAGVRHAHG